MAMTAGRRGFGVAQAAVVSAVLWTAALVLSLTLASGVWRSGLVVGVVCAIVSGAAGLGLTAMAEGRPINVALLSKVSGFLIRMLLVAVGLVVTIRGLQAEPLGFVCTYFPLFFLSTVIEQLMAMSAARTEAPQAPNNAGGGADR